MKIALAWLREWVTLPNDLEQLSTLLTMAGFEVEGISHPDLNAILEVNIPPNRGDCLSVYGLAREIALLQDKEIKIPKEIVQLQQAEQPFKTKISHEFQVKVMEREACPCYLGRIFENVDNQITTPDWIQQRLAASGIKSINAVVDITNYVMLEFGQPLHAFDLAKLKNGIEVRNAKSQEKILLLNGKTVTLSSDTLVIADANAAQAIAGVMGSLSSGVTLDTRFIFLECATFTTMAVAGKARSYGLQSDAAFRFERGVAPNLMELTLTRATALLLEIVGGQVSPVLESKVRGGTDVKPAIHLRYKQIERILGITLSNKAIENILQRLGCHIEPSPEGWNVIPPIYRYDVNSEIDLIEEIARIEGYQQIPARHPRAEIKVQHTEKAIPLANITQTLIDRGYFEAITYSFVDTEIQNLLDPDNLPLPLTNPISPEMAVMRTQLWAGLLKAAIYNQNRQQDRIRLFETGLCFLQKDGQLIQEERIAGLAIGSLYPEQWGVKARNVDFYDIKGDVQALFDLTNSKDNFIFLPCKHSALHPGIASSIMYQDKPIGYIGALHPNIQEKLDLQGSIYLFEIKLAALSRAKLPKVVMPSKFPAIRRDLALLVDQRIPMQQIVDTIKQYAREWLQDLHIFDIYQGKNIPNNKKSVAISLLIQHPIRTLNDDEVNNLIKRIVTLLDETYNILLRE